MWSLNLKDITILNTHVLIATLRHWGKVIKDYPAVAPEV